MSPGKNFSIRWERVNNIFMFPAANVDKNILVQSSKYFVFSPTDAVHSLIVQTYCGSKFMT
jgi:hypothetical protein